MRDENGFQLYQEDILNKLEFSWGGYKINGTEMKMEDEINYLRQYAKIWVGLSPFYHLHVTRK